MLDLIFKDPGYLIFFPWPRTETATVLDIIFHDPEETQQLFLKLFSRIQKKNNINLDPIFWSPEGKQLLFLTLFS